MPGYPSRRASFLASSLAALTFLSVPVIANAQERDECAARLSLVQDVWFADAQKWQKTADVWAAPSPKEGSWEGWSNPSQGAFNAVELVWGAGAKSWNTAASFWQPASQQFAVTQDWWISQESAWEKPGSEFDLLPAVKGAWNGSNGPWIAASGGFERLAGREWVLDGRQWEGILTDWLGIAGGGELPTAQRSAEYSWATTSQIWGASESLWQASDAHRDGLTTEWVFSEKVWKAYTNNWVPIAAKWRAQIEGTPKTPMWDGMIADWKIDSSVWEKVASPWAPSAIGWQLAGREWKNTFSGWQPLRSQDWLAPSALWGAWQGALTGWDSTNNVWAAAELSWMAPSKGICPSDLSLKPSWTAPGQ
jgi:hypothetical protein